MTVAVLVDTSPAVPVDVGVVVLGHGTDALRGSCAGVRLGRSAPNDRGAEDPECMGVDLA